MIRNQVYFWIKTVSVIWVKFWGLWAWVDYGLFNVILWYISLWNFPHLGQTSSLLGFVLYNRMFSLQCFVDHYLSVIFLLVILMSVLRLSPPDFPISISFLITLQISVQVKIVYAYLWYFQVIFSPNLDVVVLWQFVLRTKVDTLC